MIWSKLQKSAQIPFKLGKNEPFSLEMLMRICKVFNYGIGDALKVIED